MTDASGQPSARIDSFFLVERYVTPASATGLPGSVARMAQLCETSGTFARAAQRVHYVNSMYVSTDDTCFCLFRAPTAEAVQSLNDEGRFAMDRITAAVLLHPST